MQDQSNKDELLDQATALLRDGPLVQGPDEDLIEQTLARLAVESNKQTNFKWKAFIMKNRPLAAAAAIAVVSAVTLLCIVPRSSSVAFGDVLEKVRALSAVSFDMEGTVRPSGQPAHQIRGQIFVQEPSKMREEIKPDGTVVIIDGAAGRQLMLNPSSKTAVQMEIKKENSATTQRMNMLDEFRNFNSKDFKSMGEKMVNQQKLVGFVKHDNLGNVTIWVNPQTQLPVQMEFAGGGLMPMGDFKFTDFDWNPRVDDSMFSLTPPEGYKLQKLSMDMSGVGEKDLLSGLNQLAELDNGRFPDSLSQADIIAAISTAKGPYFDSETARQNVINKFTPVIRAMVFLSSKDGTDWHYAGKGAKLGEANRPILWYKPKGSQLYHVIDATLSVHEADAAHLPEIESVVIGQQNAR